MQVPSAGSSYPSGTSYSAAGVNQADRQFAALLGGDNDPESILQKMTSNGLQSMWSWQIDQLKQKVAAEVMGQMHLTPQQIAAMPAQQRAEIENRIIKAVEEKVREMIEQQMRNKNKDPLGISISAPADTGNGIGAALDISV